MREFTTKDLKVGMKFVCHKGDGKHDGSCLKDRAIYEITHIYADRHSLQATTPATYWDVFNFLRDINRGYLVPIQLKINPNFKHYVKAEKRILNPPETTIEFS